MPIPEYTCESCGEEFEEIVLSHSNVKDELPCPKCGKPAKRRNFPSNHGFNATALARSRQ